MAEGNKHFHEFGYPDERFESVLSDNLHCAICSCVLKDPVMCKNEHCFCRGCITKHLQNYHTCPSCKQDLTVESLADVPRIVRNLLSEQRIRCDHYERGCEEIVQLGNLASHVAVCGKAPVVCVNEECSSEINREDQFRHENEECRFREVSCRNCKEMGSMVQEIGASLGGLCEHVEKLNTSVNEVKTGLTAVEYRLEEMEKKFENRFEEMENRFEKVENQFLKMENPKFKDGQHEGVHDERESARSDQATAADPKSDMKDAKNPIKHTYVVAGGYGGGYERILNSVEFFDKPTNYWRTFDSMKKCRAKASSVVYNGQVLVTGGISQGISDAKYVITSMEQCRRSPNPFLPPSWSMLSANLPQTLMGHCSVLYNDRLIVLGGYDEVNGTNSCEMIYEIQLHFPFTTKVLAKLPSSRYLMTMGYGVILVNDKILIFGGCGSFVLATASVTMYDIIKNEFQELAPLPYEVCKMATVRFGESVILAGGSDGSICRNIKKTVVSYNIETGKSTELPPMKQERCECCAVVDGNSLVVMGGRGQDVILNSVEVFDFKTSIWSDLRSMNEARRGFIAEIV